MWGPPCKVMYNQDGEAGWSEGPYSQRVVSPWTPLVTVLSACVCYWLLHVFGDPVKDWAWYGCVVSMLQALFAM